MLGYLFLFFVALSIIAIVGTVLLFVVKKAHATDVLMVLMTAFSIGIAYINASSQPTNYVGTQIICWLIGLVAIAGLGIRFVKKEQLLISKLLIVASVIGGLGFLFF